VTNRVYSHQSVGRARDSGSPSKKSRARIPLIALRASVLCAASQTFAFLILTIWMPPLAQADKPTPARHIQTRPGFAVERVLQARPRKGADLGSWVAMCFDDKGRIYASAEGKQGLFRITPPALQSDEQCKVELISDKWGHCQGMAWINGSLYVVQHERPQGGKVAEKDYVPDAILRLKDTDGDDKLDTAERLFQFAKVLGGKRVWYEHHIHGIVPGPDGKSIYVVSGDRNLPPCEKSRVAKHWNRDSWPHKAVLKPFSGGWVMRADLDGKNAEYLCMGLRNCYDIAFNRHGDLLTYDSDLEYDIRMPAYRPTAIRQILTGTDSGWAGSANEMKWSWTPKWEDIQPPLRNIGPGSPTGVCFGYGAKFPARYQKALFACDWSIGRMFAVHLTPKGATYDADPELFLSAKGLPITDLAVSPIDGALYFTTGGRGAGSALFRVIYRGKESTAPSPEKQFDPAAAALHKLRRELESFHGEINPRAITAAWPQLAHEDRAIRGAARAAVEWQPVAEWKQRTLNEKIPRRALQALLALARSTDGDKTVQPAILAALDRLDVARLPADEQCWYLRVLTISASRHGMYPTDVTAKLVAKLAPLLPSPDRRVTEELVAMLAAFEHGGVIVPALDLLQRSRTQEEQIFYSDALVRVATSETWTGPLRERFFRLTAERVPQWKGGGFVRPKRQSVTKAVVALLSDDQRRQFAAQIAALEKPAATKAAAAPPRAVVKEWKLDDLASELEAGLKRPRDLANGRMLYTAAKCSTCHSFQGDGGLAGPDLSYVGGHYKPRDLLAEILNPSKVINPQYGQVIYELKDGKTITGRAVETTDDVVTVATDPTNPFANHVHVKKQNVESVTPSRVSAMPVGLLNTLTRDDVLDLLAYLTRRRE
jgi:putative heme-binding domain-containing protein